MDYVYAIILGIIQGITEFFPISSSGHLLLLPQIFNVQDQGLTVDAVLHLATALAIFYYFRAEWFSMLRSWKKSRLLRKIIIASIPAVGLGLLFDSLIEDVLRSPWVVVVMLIGVAVFMWWVEQNYTEVKVVGQSETADKNLSQIGELDAIIIGLFQSIALIPGTSRSGVTITASMFRGLPRHVAAKFSFLLGGPITFGAGIFKLVDLVQTPDVDWGFVGIAGIVTFVVAVWAINWLDRKSVV